MDENSKNPIAPSSLNDKNNVIFEQFISPDSVTNLGQNETVIGIRSVFNGKLLTARDRTTFNLYADADDFGDEEKFLVYYGRQDIIGLKSKSSGKFISAFPNNKKPLYVNRDHFREWEMFKVVEILDR